MHGGARSPAGRRALRVLLGIVVAAVIAEIALQLVAWRVWRSEWVGPSGDPVPGRVLLVGAGETFDEGVLLRSDAWPKDVERRLRADGVDATLVDGASPGRDSRDVLERLPLQLTLKRPELVVACVGVEDYRRRAARVVEEDDLKGRNAPFPLRFRLLSLLAAPFAADGDEVDAAAPPFVGPWHFGDLALTFEPDGRLRLGTVDGRWAFDGQQLKVALPGSELLDVGWEIEADRLALTGAFAEGEVVLFRGEPLAGPSERAQEAMRRGSWDEAEWMLMPAVRGALHDPEAAATLVELHARWGRTDAAREQLAELESDPAAPASARARARIAVGRVAEGVELVVDDLAAHAGDDALVRVLRRLPAGAAADRVADAAERALAEAGPAARTPLAWIVADLRAAAGRAADAVRAAAIGLAAVEGEVDPGDVPVIARSAADGAWAAALGALSEPERARVEAHRTRLAEADAETSTILERNLTRLVALARFYRADVLLLDPSDDPGASAVRQAVADRVGADLVPCAPTREALSRAVHGALLEHFRPPTGR